MADTMFEYWSIIREAIQTMNIFGPSNRKKGRKKTDKMERTRMKAVVNKLAFEIASFCVDHSDRCSDSNPLYIALESTVDAMTERGNYGCDSGIIWLILDFVALNMGKWNRSFHEESISKLMELKTGRLL